MKSITLAGRWTVNLHNLNNEGAEGNFTQPRTVTIVQDGHLYSVNAISGDMMKHIHADYFRQAALSADAEGTDELLPLSKNSTFLDPNRIATEPEMLELLKDTKAKNADIMDYVIETCSLTDVHGILMTAPKRMLPRKSRIEFGWVVAVPEISRTEHFIHAKYAVENATKYDRSTKDQTNEGQMIFHRPVSSAEYAFLAHVEISRIGVNDITLKSPISDESQKARIKATLSALAQTILHPYGAGRSQQAPHVAGFQGVLITSDSRVPAATVSPLESNYIEQSENIVKQFNRLEGGMQLHRITNVSHLVENIANLTDQLI